MLLKAIGASALLDLLDCNVTKRIAIVTKYHLFVPNVQCVETNRGLEISVAYADLDIPARNVMLPSTHVPHLHVETELNANNFNKADSSADANLDGKDHFVTKTLTTVPTFHVLSELTVLTLSTTTDVTVQKDLTEKDVRTKLIYVKRLDVSMETVLINCSATNVFVNQDGLEICAMKILMIVSEAQLIQATPQTHVKMEDNALIKSMTSSVNAFPDLLARNVR